jgi:hypothetical protein
MRTVSAAPPRHSRFQVLTDGEAAWACDGSGTSYRFDGFCFSRRRRRDRSFSVVPSWMTPPYGWLLVSECPCALWITGPERAERTRTVSRSHVAA